MELYLKLIVSLTANGIIYVLSLYCSIYTVEIYIYIYTDKKARLVGWFVLIIYVYKQLALNNCCLRRILNS